MHERMGSSSCVLGLKQKLKSMGLSWHEALELTQLPKNV